MTRVRKSKEIIHEGRYAAEVEIELITVTRTGRRQCRGTMRARSKPCGLRCVGATSPRPRSVAECSN